MKMSDLRKNLDSANEFYKWKDGQNVLRFVSEIIPIYKTFTSDNKFVSLYFSKEKADLAKKAGEKVNTRFMVYSINRATGVIQQAEFGSMIMAQISSLAETKGYEFETVPEYDFNIKRTGTGLETEYMVVADRANTPITEDEKQKILGLPSLIMILAKDASDEVNPSDLPF